MSKAFVKESEDQWLSDIPATMAALLLFLRRENNGARIYEKKSYLDPASGQDVHEMSNGLSYALNDEGKWQVMD